MASTILSPGDRSLLPVLPMVYAAWADGELAPAEIDAIRTAAQCLDGISAGACAQLDRWLDPHNPPSPADLREILRQTRASLAESASRPASLAELGVALAEGEPLAESWRSEDAKRALLEIQHAAGLFGRTGLGEFLAPLAPAEVLDLQTPWSVLALTEVLESTYRDERTLIRDWLKGTRHISTELSKEEYRAQVMVWAKELAERGVGELALLASGSDRKRADGAAVRAIAGPEHDLGRFIAAFETLAFFDLSLLVKCGVQFGLFGGSILHLGTASHHERYLKKAAKLELAGCFAMTELGHGSNVRDLETVARFDREAGDFVLHSPSDAARKEWIGNAAMHGELATVFAQLEIDGENHGVHAFVVQIRDESGAAMPGVDIRDSGHKLGLNGVDNGQLLFDQVRVPRDQLLDRFASVSAEGVYESPIASPGKRFFTMLSTLVGGRVSIAAASVSVAKVGLTIALRYAARRRQFGPEGAEEIRLLEYPVHRRRLIPRLATTYALNFAVHDLVDRYVETRRGDDSAAKRELETLAAGMKAYASWHATDVVQESREACGGQGYRSENRLGVLKADSEIFTTFEGDNTVLMQLVGRGLLGAFRAQFADLRWYDAARQISQMAFESFSDRNPITVRWTDEKHLQSLAFHTQVLKAREDSLTISLARRLKKRIDAGLDPFLAFGEVQTHVIALARAHIERQVHAAIVKRAEVDGPLSDVLTRLASLYGLSLLEADRAWFLENGFFEPNKSKAIRDQVDALCDGLAHEVLALCDAFDIPEESLAAPIARRYSP
ncbi:MAG: acyl-CoA dehydrogenase [Myxococcota bacterium]